MFAVPETCADGLCSESADVYSVGMFMYTRLNGGLLPWQTRPGDNSELQTILDRRAEHLPEIPGVEPMLMNILRKATSPDPLERYRSAEEMLCALSGQQKTSVYSSCFSREIRVGDTVQFGTYYSEKGIFNPRMKPMEWLVLAIDATNEEKPCALIISRDTVDCMKFSDSASFANWDNSVLNGFLNREFLNVLCRSGADRERIRNSGMLKDVFLLSADDVVSYRDILLPNLAKATKHAAQNGVLQNEYGNTCWWLRSTDSNGRHASFVAYNGELRRSGCRVDSDGIGVRPAIWLTL